MFCLFFFYKIRIVPEHFWMARRFLPVILPCAVLFAAAAALTGVRGGFRPTRMLRATIGLVFIALLAMQYARAAPGRAAARRVPGRHPQARKARGRNRRRDLLIVESRDASDTHVLALPLA